ncbi:hypothetical protein ACFFLM_18535 [Deinococcus oregonensis]|uniref:ABC transporter permease n=1 Tax=Deinococcus oregonensis TaxID=1805970 RepID=A0ABV6B4Z1_9DEIO
MNQFLESVRFQMREYIETTKLSVEIILTLICLAVINPSDDIKEATVLVLFVAYAISVVCCFRIMPRFGGSSRDLLAITLGRGKFELSQVISALAFAVAGSMILGFYIVLSGKSEALLLPKIALQCALACTFCSATIFYLPTLTKSPVVPILYGIVGFIYPVLGKNYSLLGVIFASGDRFYFSKFIIILMSAYLIFKRSQSRDYIAD